MALVKSLERHRRHPLSVGFVEYSRTWKLLPVQPDRAASVDSDSSDVPGGYRWVARFPAAGHVRPLVVFFQPFDCDPETAIEAGCVGNKPDAGRGRESFGQHFIDKVVRFVLRRAVPAVRGLRPDQEQGADVGEVDTFLEQLLLDIQRSLKLRIDFAAVSDKG